MTELPTAKPNTEPRSITPRAIALGFLLVLVAVIVPTYSDNIRDSTYLIGNQLPVILVSTIAILCVAINPLLGQRRLRSGELAVAVAMMFIACAFPTSGFFRFFHPLLAGLIYNKNLVPKSDDYVDALPDWLVPSKDPASWIISEYHVGIDPSRGHTLADTWGPWLMPYLAWGTFVLPMFLGILFLCAVMRRQWVVNERLSYPLATIPLELMADPEPGHRLNALWRNRLLWLGVLIPVGIHLLNGANQFNTSIPKIATNFDITNALSEFPWNTLSNNIKQNAVYFVVIGVTFFIPLDVAFSLWFFFFAYNIMNMALTRAGIPISADRQSFQHLGIWLGYAFLMFWIARHHVLYVLKNLRSPREPDEFLPYWASVSGTILCAATATGFLIFCGMQPLMAAMLVALIFGWMMVVARVVMESGMLFVLFPGNIEPTKLLTLFFGNLTTVAAAAKLDVLRNWILASLSSRMIFVDQRETLMPFAANALRLSEQTNRRGGLKMFLLLCAALVTALFVGGATHHLLTYEYGRQTFDNGYGSTHFPQTTLKRAIEFADPTPTQASPTRPWDLSAGVAVTAVVGLTRVYWVGSPFHPIGPLLINTYAMDKFWFSILLAWMLKLIVLRWGGASVYHRARPFFMGLIIGDSLAAVFWAGVGLFVQWPDPTKPFQILPG